MKKIILAAIAALLIPTIAVSAHAADTEYPAASLNGNIGAVSEDMPTDTDETVESGNAPQTSEENFFKYIFDSIFALSGEILSGGALISSLMMLINMKRKVMPCIDSTEKRIISRLEEHENSSAAREEKYLLLAEECGRLDESREKIEKCISALDGMGLNAEMQAADISFLKDALMRESELLLEILLQTNLPEYRKQKLSDKIGALISSGAGGASDESGKSV